MTLWCPNCEATLNRCPACSAVLWPRRIAELEAALFRANAVTRQTQEIVDQRGRRIAELQTEVATLTASLRRLFETSNAEPAVCDTSSDAVEFPVNALRFSR